MQSFDIQITTELGEEVVVSVVVGDRQYAEMTAILIVESDLVGTMGRRVVDCLAL